MNHYIEEVDDGNREGVLAEWKAKAMMERAEALDAYVTRVLRRPLGKLLVSIRRSYLHNPTVTDMMIGLPRISRVYPRVQSFPT
jgi:hypothetical protein